MAAPRKPRPPQIESPEARKLADAIFDAGRTASTPSLLFAILVELRALRAEATLRSGGPPA